MAKDTIRVGFIGAGGNTRSRHIPGLKAQASVELAAVANRSVASGRKIAREFGIEKVCADWQEVLDDDSIDAICIGTWPYMHETLTVASLEAGKHVMCEARMAMNSAEGHRMLAASQRHPRLTAQIVPSPMTLPFDQTIIAMISGGFIGELIALDARIAAGSDFPNPNAPFHWRHDRTLSGNNIMSMGIWYEGIMRWVGPMKTVNAVGQSVVNHRRDESGRRQALTIPDHVDITGELELGGQMRLNVTTVAGLAAYPIDIHIFGSEGTLRLYQAPGGQTTLAAGKRGDKRLKDVKIPKSKQGVWRVEEEFINAIRGKEEITHTDFATAVKYMEWTDAVTMSLRHREVVKLPLMGN
ncbi:MAG: Gfo/Idh/MocA family oxidoreductase [Pseudomonadota bacterium]|nr:Gfo/Idh/MocA family oxidoreductase [Pseudomonadota bacterium]